MTRSPFDQHCVDLVQASPKRNSRNCFLSAFNHLERAAAIAQIDPAMAAFRGLTAEEEAASGLMYCIKERGYKNADRLKPKDHAHKNAASPFLDVLTLFFSETKPSNFKEARLLLEGVGAERRLMIGFLISIDGEDQLAQPIPPLNFTVTSNSQRISYRRQIEALAAHREVKTISEYIRTQANLRNLLLYAGPEGFPKQVELGADFLKVRQDRVMALARGYLLVQPYGEQLSFVQDALDAFLAMIGALKEHDLHENV